MFELDLHTRRAGLSA